MIIHWAEAHSHTRKKRVKLENRLDLKRLNIMIKTNDYTIKGLECEEVFIKSF